MKGKLPIYDICMDEETLGISTISLVDDPAVAVEWMAFSKVEEEYQLKCSIIDDGMEHRVLGVVCRANFPIYRRDEKNGEYYIRFSKETIKAIAQRLLANGYQNYINLMHQSDAYVEGVQAVEFFIKDTAMGINPKGFENVEDGSLFAVYKVDNDAVWNAIKEGVFKGFSLEGYFGYQKSGTELKTIADLLEYIRNNNK